MADFRLPGAKLLNGAFSLGVPLLARPGGGLESRRSCGTTVALVTSRMSDRRDDPREEVTVPVACRVGHQTFEARARNISKGGMFLETDWLFDPTGEIRMAIELPGGTVSATGRAMRFIARRDPHRLGVAVQFLE